MNFLLQLVGLRFSDSGTSFLRPDARRRSLIRLVDAVEADAVHEAFALASRLTQAEITTNTERLAAAQLALMAGNPTAAKTLFNEALAQLDPPVAQPPETAHAWETNTRPIPLRMSLESLLTGGHKAFRSGRYALATQTYQLARERVEELLAIHAGLLVADLPSYSMTSLLGKTPLTGLAKLSNQLLHLIARSHLGKHVAEKMPSHGMELGTDESARWEGDAGYVQTLIHTELSQLEQMSRTLPDHAELHARIGLIAAAVDEEECAKKALKHVLALHPANLTLAARLFAIHINRGNFEDAFAPLVLAFLPSPGSMRGYIQLARAFSDAETFDASVASFCDHPTTYGAMERRANIAFALSELGLLNAERTHWMSPDAWSATTPSAS